MQKYAYVHIPAGCTVLVGDDVSSLIDLGIIPEAADSNIKITYDLVSAQGSRLEKVLSWAKNMKASASTSLYQINMENINKLTGGVMNITKTNGQAVTGENCTFQTWSKNKCLLLPGQNSNGEKQTVTSIKNGSKTLVSGTDYIQAQDGMGRWGIVILDASTAVTSSSLVVVYGYTPTSKLKATMGDDIVTVQGKCVQFLKEIGSKTFSATLYSALMTNGIQLSFPAVSSDKLVEIPIEIQGELDTTRAKGDQLIEIIDELGE